MSSKRTPESPIPGRYRATKASAFTLQSRRIARERTKDKERDSSGSGSGSIGLKTRGVERRRRFDKPPDITTPPTSPIVLIRVGPEKRLFAAHEAILCASPFFAAHCTAQTPSSNASRPELGQQPPSKRIDLPEEQAEVLSCVLEYLYKGDYYPRLRHNSRTRTWELEDADAGVGAGASGELGQATATVFHHRAQGVILRDTAIYCAAETYNLPHLQRLALRKQGLHTGIQCSTILASARFAYANTPDTESKLRAHYLALIVRSRSTFMRSGTMQAEMERGGKLFFDLFVALCNHMDDYADQSVESSAVTTHC
ncbi:BTB/POZ-like [Penicillium digitatum]|nr:BTB/POZ-like [Penicillium digitatum]